MMEHIWFQQYLECWSQYQRARNCFFKAVCLLLGNAAASFTLLGTAPLKRQQKGLLLIKELKGWQTVTLPQSGKDSNNSSSSVTDLQAIMNLMLFTFHVLLKSVGSLFLSPALGEKPQLWNAKLLNILKKSFDVLRHSWGLWGVAGRK